MIRFICFQSDFLASKISEISDEYTNQWLHFKLYHNNQESFHTCTVKLHSLILPSHQVTVNFSVQITVIRSLKICYS